MPSIRKKKKKRKKKHILLEDPINYDILQLLASGLSQQQIADTFKSEGRTPRTVKSIEKRIQSIKRFYKANNLFHLGVIIKQRNHFFIEDRI